MIRVSAFWPAVERVPSRWPRRWERARRFVRGFVPWSPLVASASAVGVFWLIARGSA